MTRTASWILLGALLASCGDDVARLDDMDAAVWAKRLRDDATREAAIARLQEAGASGVPILTALLEQDGMVRGIALEHLARLGPAAASAAPKLAALLNQRDTPTLVMTALALGRVGKRTPAAILGLERLMSARDSRVQVAGAMAYWSLSGDPERSHQILLKALVSRKPGIRIMAAEAYQTLGAESVDPLTIALADDHPAVRIAAAQALGELGALAKSARAALTAMKNDTNVGVRDSAEFALQEIG